ncbi:GNAT family N-acetyltransferase [Paenibacillus psychroresistens]|uniref:GNAT family N-acetyltransferase n=1 Tax=Paenibacillus psychroresistens TaxID=1778678 RepID=A0A6B8RJB7_9BACL|nr:GNAT family N-acetyltransferase [Paenibacillus psychroresistens]QGQ96139.1 GNAT family N-acetyltransferase [Paenibacillus psychroresistens]
MKQITIRTELIKDYPQVAELHIRAFNEINNRAITAMVALHRQNLLYDPELSLVAEFEGQVVGHVLFYPHDFYVAGELLKGVVLSPLGVSPELQREGIGGQLIAEGHKRALEKGYAFSILLGHPTYYPRFGYQTHMYGTCLTKVDLVDVSDVLLEERQVQLEDITLLREMWQLWFEDNSLAIVPENSLLDWISPNIEIRSVIVIKGGETIGYLRYKKNEPLQPRYFLAASQVGTSDLLGHIRALSLQAGSSSSLMQLPVHPQSMRTKQWIPYASGAEIVPWDAAMLCVLDESCDIIRKYMERVRHKEDSIGSILWSVEFEIL